MADKNVLLHDTSGNNLYPKTKAEDIVDSINVSKLTGTLPVSKGGTGATSAATALSNLGLSVQTVTPTLTKTSGGTCTVAMRRFGQVVFVSVTVTASGSVAAGSNIYVGKLTNFPAPIFNTIGCAYYDARAVMIQIATDGTLTARNLISAASSGAASQTAWCYLTSA